MFWFKRRRQIIEKQQTNEAAADEAIQDMKNQTHAASKEATKQAARLIEALKPDSITLKIHNATGAGKHVR